MRGVAEALVSAPIRWDEVDDADPGDFTIATMPKRFAELGDLHAGIDDAVFALDELLEWADRDAATTRTLPSWTAVRGSVPSLLTTRRRPRAGRRTRPSAPGAGSGR